MILSASRRTDIPCCYPQWFIKRLKAGFVLTRNPFNMHQVSRIPLSLDNIECIVFWTKNALPLMDCLDELDRMGYRYMFQYTLTPYGTDIEKRLPDKELIINNILALSQRIGRERIVWRYDPILLSGAYTMEFHRECFEKLCSLLHTSVDHVIFSFIDMYKKNSAQGLRGLGREEILSIAQVFGSTSAQYGLPIRTCCEDVDLSRFGIAPGACIDTELLGRICGRPLRLKRAAGQRTSCLCAESVDVGSYHTCWNGCIYCYAVDNKKLPARLSQYDEDGEMICDTLDPDTDRVTIRHMKKL